MSTDNTILVPTRVFRMGSVELADPDPTLTNPTDALRLYSHAYPALAHANLSEPALEGDRLVYTVEKPPVKTKGAST